MNKVLTKIKQNWLFLIIPIIFISFLCINLNVVHFGDDYYYLTFRNIDFSEYFSKLFEHYQNDNGRFLVHMLATMFLKLPLPFWAIINSIFLTGICYFSSKLVNSQNKGNAPLFCGIMFFFLASLNISITRQSVYWLTGSFNYVYPIFLFFAYWYSLSKIENKKWFIGSLFLGFISAATMEQAAMMTFGLTVLTVLSKLKSLADLKNIKQILRNNFKLLVLCGITLIGLFTVMLAPSQFKRIELENAKDSENSFISTLTDNGIYIISQYTISKDILPYCFLFNALIIIYYSKNGNKNEKYLFSTFSILNFGITLFNINFFTSPSVPTMLKYILVAITLLTYTINLIYFNFKVFKALITPLTISAILLVGSQFMMIVSPVLGPRNFIFGLILFAFIILILAREITFNKLVFPFTSILIIFALALNCKTALGYAKTKQIEEKNQEIIGNSSILTDKTQEITLYKFPDDNYGWSMPYTSSYHEFYFKHHYQIKCKINWNEI